MMTIMRIHNLDVSEHAEDQMNDRKISVDRVRRALATPKSVEPGERHIVNYRGYDGTRVTVDPVRKRIVTIAGDPDLRDRLCGLAGVRPSEAPEVREWDVSLPGTSMPTHRGRVRLGRKPEPVPVFPVEVRRLERPEGSAPLSIRTKEDWEYYKTYWGAWWEKQKPGMAASMWK